MTSYKLKELKMSLLSIPAGKDLPNDFNVIIYHRLRIIMKITEMNPKAVAVAFFLSSALVFPQLPPATFFT